MKTTKRLIRRFAKIGIRLFPERFQSLKEEIVQSNLSIIFETYVGKMLLYSMIAFVLALIYLTIGMYIFFGLPIWLALASGFIVALAVAFAVFTAFYYYPYHILSSRRRSIEANLPFAVNHLSAIATSGVPPHIAFQLLTDVHEYGEAANEAKRIVRNIEVFGMDVVTAIKEVANRTPSMEFKQILNGIVSTISTGGNLTRYLDNSAHEALADYRLKREKYLATLSTYADFYTAVLIAAPLFFISILSVMALIGGQLFGLSIPTAMSLGIYLLIPVLNILFILFIHFTQPAV